MNRQTPSLRDRRLKQSSVPKPIAIIGVGNYLMGDEGAGIHAIEFLKKYEWHRDTELIDAGTPGPSLLHMMEGRRHVIIIDCADFGAKPGAIGIWDAAKLKVHKGRSVGLHAVEVTEVIELARRIGKEQPRITIVGIQPAEIKMRTKLSPPVKSALERLTAVIADEVK